MGILTQTHNGLNFVGTETYIQSDGTTVMTILSGGNVGIGTTNPSAKLTVAGLYTTEFTGNDVIFNRDGTSYLKNKNANGSLSIQTAGSNAIVVDSSQNIQFSQYTAGLLQTDASGNVSVDTSTYLTSYTETQTLDDVTTLGSSTDNSISVGGLEIFQDLSAAGAIDYPLVISSKDDNNGINQLGGEGVGIKFRIAGNDATAPGNSLVGASIAAIRKSNSDTDSDTHLAFFTSQNDEVLDEAMRITSDGTIGIGLTNPTHALDVDGAVRTTAGGAYGLRVHTNSGITASNNYMNFFTSQSNGWAFNANGTGADNTTKVVITAGGDVGVGTTNPAAKMHIGPDALVSGYTTTRTTLAVSDTTNGAELILRGQSPRIWFDATATGNGEIYMDGASLDILSGDPRAGNEGSSRFNIDSSGNIQFGAYGAGLLQTDASGNVSVDTTTYSTFSGDYDDLTNKPTIPVSGTDFDPVGTDNSTNVTLVTTNHDYLSISGQAITLDAINLDDINGGATAGLLKTNASGELSVDTTSYSTFSGDYDDLTNKPTLGTAAAAATTDFAAASHNHAASDITSGTFDIARIPTVDSKISEFIPKNIYQAQSWGNADGVFMPMVKGGLYSTNVSSVTGRLRIKLPHYRAAIMQSFVIDVYEYNTDRMQSYVVSGYTYNDTNATWWNTSAIALADSDNRNLPVKFGSDETNDFQCVSIGETNTTWSYPQVVIRDYMGGYGASTSEVLNSWTIEFVTTDSATYDVSHTTNQPMVDKSRIAGTLTVAQGGTGATTAAGARTNLGAASTSVATTSANGLMSSGDKTKLDGIASGAEVNVQSDWNATTGDALILNKPTLGTAASAAATDFVAVTGDTMTGKLTLNGDLDLVKSSGNNTLTINSTSGGTPVIYMNSPTRGWGQFVNGTDLWFKDETGNIVTMVLEAGGNVGIGTTNPGAKLDVQGNTLITGNANVNAQVRAGYQVSTGDARVSAGDGRTGSGNAYIDLIGDTTYSTYGLRLQRAGGNTASSYISHRGTGTMYIRTLESAALAFKTADTERMTIASGGNIGINDTSPSYKLDVNGAIRATGDITANSDARLKENVETIPNALDKVTAMRGVTFNKIGDEKRSVGVIAQELIEVLPEAVRQDNEGVYNVAYGNITGVLIEAIKELTAEVNSLKEQLKNK